MRPENPMTTKAPAVRTSGVTKTFGRGESAVQALRGVEFEAYCGEMVMVVGPSGCGKTTFLSVVCGTMQADEGSVEVFGTDLIHLSTGKLTAFRGKNVGFIFQQFNLIPTWNIVENASVPLILNGASKRHAEAEAARLLTKVGLGKRLGAFPRELSGGQQQRVAIARALVHQPRLLICDEPTASLDAASGQKVMELLKASACRPDRCVIVVTHDSRIFSFSDRIVEMGDGVVKGVHNSGEYNVSH
jgi:putative ABC transport system ATP-binding protein